MKIGELSKASATSIESIRFYERAGLIPEPARTEGNYRIYGAAHLQRLAFIRRCRALDMALDEIRVLLGFKDAPHAQCEDVNGLLDQHIGHVASRLQELRLLERQLRELRALCSSIESGADCGILKQLSRAGSGSPARSKLRADPHGQGAGVHGRPTRQSQGVRQVRQVRQTRRPARQARG